MKANPQIDQDRLSIVLAGVAVGFVLSRAIKLPTQQIGLNVLGSQLGVQLSTHWLMVAFVVGLVITGVHSLFSHYLFGRPGQARPTFVSWILPGLTALTSGVLLARTEETQAWLLLVAAGIALLGIVIKNEFRSLDLAGFGRPGVQVLGKGLAYLLVLTLMILIYETGARALLVAPAVFAVSALLAMRFLWSPTQELGQVILYGGVVGLVMGQAVWALNYWQITPFSGGLLLLLIFHFATGIAGQFLLGRMSGRVLLEYGVVVLAAAVLIQSLLA